MILPWLPKKVIKWLDNFLTEEKTIFEYGSGNSTIYFDQKARIVSVEHEEKWYNIIKPKLKNTEYHLLHPKDYPSFITKYPERYFDLVVIDGLQREECVKHALNHIKKGGFLLLDDSQRERYEKLKDLMKKYKKTEFEEDEHETIIWKV